MILDTAPIGMVTDTQLISRVADMSIYVCRAGYTPKAGYLFINELRDHKKLPNLCTIINDVNIKPESTDMARMANTAMVEPMATVTDTMKK